MHAALTRTDVGARTPRRTLDAKRQESTGRDEISDERHFDNGGHRQNHASH